MKKITVSIAISAYNEEDNILNFLKSVVSQKEEGFVINQILVIDDCSEDRTLKQISKVKDSRIKVLVNKRRKGKSSNLNAIYSKVKADVLVQSDADVVFSHKYVVRDIVKPLLNKSKYGMCGGNPMPAEAKTFIEAAVNHTVEAYIKLRPLVRNGENPLSADGRLLAFKKEVYKKLSIPVDMIANDEFAYFSNLSMGFRYKFVKSAIVSFRSPQNLRDQIVQNTRFRAAPLRLKKYFPNSLLEQEYSIDMSLLLRIYIVTFIKHPVHCVFIFILNLYTKILAHKAERLLTAKWTMAVSTKKIQYV